MTAPTLEYKKSFGEDWPASRSLGFSECTEFSELFSDWKWHEHGKRAFPIEGHVSDFCSCLRTVLDESLHVKVRPELVQWINKNMIHPDNDTWYFELVTRRDGTLVIVKNNAILASRWLALLDTEKMIKDIRDNA